MLVQGRFKFLTVAALAAANPWHLCCTRRHFGSNCVSAQDHLHISESSPVGTSLLLPTQLSKRQLAVDETSREAYRSGGVVHSLEVADTCARNGPSSSDCAFTQRRFCADEDSNAVVTPVMATECTSEDKSQIVSMLSDIIMHIALRHPSSSDA